MDAVFQLTAPMPTARHPAAQPQCAGRYVVIKHFGMIYSGDDPVTDSMALKLSRGGAGSFRLGTGCRDPLVATLGLAGSPEASSSSALLLRAPWAAPGQHGWREAAISQPATCTHTPIPVLTRTDEPLLTREDSYTDLGPDARTHGHGWMPGAH